MLILSNRNCLNRQELFFPFVNLGCNCNCDVVTCGDNEMRSIGHQPKHFQIFLGHVNNMEAHSCFLLMVDVVRFHETKGSFHEALMVHIVCVDGS